MEVPLFSPHGLCFQPHSGRVRPGPLPRRAKGGWDLLVLRGIRPTSFYHYHRILGPGRERHLRSQPALEPSQGREWSPLVSQDIRTLPCASALSHLCSLCLTTPIKILLGETADFEHGKSEVKVSRGCGPGGVGRAGDNPGNLETCQAFLVVFTSCIQRSSVLILLCNLPIEPLVS